MTTAEDSTGECDSLESEDETVPTQEENLLLEIEELQFQKNLMSMNFALRLAEETCKNVVEELIKDIELKHKEYEKINEDSTEINKASTQMNAISTEMKDNSTQMKDRINKICHLCSDQEEQKVDGCKMNEDDFENGLEDILKNVEEQVYSMVEKEKMLQNEKQELHELVEFLENEETVLQEDIEHLKEDANAEKNALESVIKDLENKVEFWTQCCGKLFRWTKIDGCKFKDLQVKSKSVGKVAKRERARRKKLVKKNKHVVKWLKASQAKVRLEIKLKNSLDEKNLDLQIELQSLQDKLESYKSIFRSENLEGSKVQESSKIDEQGSKSDEPSSKFDKLIERNSELESEVEYLEDCLAKKETELNKVKIGYDRIKVELEEEIKNNMALEEDLKEISAKKDKFEKDLKEISAKKVRFEIDFKEISAKKDQFEMDVKDRDKAIDDLQHEISKLEDKSGKKGCFQKFFRCSSG
eukprot:Seg2397.3 transcript_id=Seg2397.3/GoldUCD/mRNA.D3Y31 product="hypothetical protein" protein_id=Seg2397.3/GoldUCD/D3Y31